MLSGEGSASSIMLLGNTYTQRQRRSLDTELIYGE